MIKAIETSYKGYRFRSRLEAKWAVFFDALGVKWDYEPEGFEFGGGVRYLPDFWLPGLGIWVEVKPPGGLSDSDAAKVLGLSYAADAPVYVTHGAPGDLGELHYVVASMMESELSDQSCPAVMDWSSHSQPQGLRIWVPIQNSGDERNYPTGKFFFKESSLGLGEDDQDSEELWSMCWGAVKASRSARFEFGESGARL